jgi:hypothetical protein
MIGWVVLGNNLVFSFFQIRRSRGCHMSVSNLWPQQCMETMLMGSLRSDMQLCELRCSLTSFHCSAGVGIATDHRLDGRWAAVRVPVGAWFSPLYVVQTCSGDPIQPPIQKVLWALSSGVKRPRREADHSPPTNTVLKNTWIHTSTPPYVFMAWCLIS